MKKVKGAETKQRKKRPSVLPSKKSDEEVEEGDGGLYDEAVPPIEGDDGEDTPCAGFFFCYLILFFSGGL